MRRLNRGQTQEVINMSRPHRPGRRRDSAHRSSYGRRAFVDLVQPADNAFYRWVKSGSGSPARRGRLRNQYNGRQASSRRSGSAPGPRAADLAQAGKRGISGDPPVFGRRLRPGSGRVAWLRASLEYGGRALGSTAGRLPGMRLAERAPWGVEAATTPTLRPGSCRRQNYPHLRLSRARHARCP